MTYKNTLKQKKKRQIALHQNEKLVLERLKKNLDVENGFWTQWEEGEGGMKGEMGTDVDTLPRGNRGLVRSCWELGGSAWCCVMA